MQVKLFAFNIADDCFTVQAIVDDWVNTYFIDTGNNINIREFKLYNTGEVNWFIALYEEE